MQQPVSTIETITTSARLDEVVRASSRSRRVAVDLESNGFHRYPERVCLVQLAIPGSVFLIDPLAVPDVGPIGALLADATVEKVLHSADYDLRSLDRDWGFGVGNLFDTSIAAAFVGSPRLGLGAVLEDLLGVKVDNSKKLQRADWTNRPLSPEAQHYAANDVLYLEQVRDLLVQRLEELSRLEWVAEECRRLEEVRYRPRDPEWAFVSIKGSRALDGRGLAVLRSLHRFRELEAVRKDRPPFKVVPDEALVALAANPRSDPASIKGLGRFGYSSASGPLRAAISEGLRARPVEVPGRPGQNDRPLSVVQRRAAADRIRLAKDWRTDLGRQLHLDPGLLWPRSSLERLAAQENGVDTEFENPEVRAWQKAEFGESLRSFLAGLK